MQALLPASMTRRWGGDPVGTVQPDTLNRPHGSGLGQGVILARIFGDEKW